MAAVVTGKNLRSSDRGGGNLPAVIRGPAFILDPNAIPQLFDRSLTLNEKVELIAKVVEKGGAEGQEGLSILYVTYNSKLAGLERVLSELLINSAKHLVTKDRSLADLFTTEITRPVVDLNGKQLFPSMLDLLKHVCAYKRTTYELLAIINSAYTKEHPPLSLARVQRIFPAAEVARILGDTSKRRAPLINSLMVLGSFPTMHHREQALNDQSSIQKMVALALRYCDWDNNSFSKARFCVLDADTKEVTVITGQDLLRKHSELLGWSLNYDSWRELHNRAVKAGYASNDPNKPVVYLQDETLSTAIPFTILKLLELGHTDLFEKLVAKYSLTSYRKYSDPSTGIVRSRQIEHQYANNKLIQPPNPPIHDGVGRELFKSATQLGVMITGRSEYSVKAADQSEAAFPEIDRLKGKLRSLSKDEKAIQLSAVDEFLSLAASLEKGQKYLKSNNYDSKSEEKKLAFVRDYREAQRERGIYPLWKEIAHIMRAFPGRRDWRTCTHPDVRLIDENEMVLFENLGQLCGYLWHLDRAICLETKRLAKNLSVPTNELDVTPFTPLRHLYSAMKLVGSEHKIRAKRIITAFNLEDNAKLLTHIQSIPNFNSKESLQEQLGSIALQLYGEIPGNLLVVLRKYSFIAGDSVVTGEQLVEGLLAIRKKESPRGTSRYARKSIIEEIRASVDKAQTKNLDSPQAQVASGDLALPPKSDFPDVNRLREKFRTLKSDEQKIYLFSLEKFLTSIGNLQSAAKYMEQESPSLVSSDDKRSFVAKYVAAQRARFIDPLWDSIKEVLHEYHFKFPRDWRTCDLSHARLVGNSDQVIFENLGQLCGFLWRMEKAVCEESTILAKQLRVSTEGLGLSPYSPMLHLYSAMKSSADSKEEREIGQVIESLNLFDDRNRKMAHISAMPNTSSLDEIEAAICEAALQLYGEIPSNLFSAMSDFEFVAGDSTEGMNLLVPMIRHLKGRVGKNAKEDVIVEKLRKRVGQSNEDQTERSLPLDRKVPDFIRELREGVRKIDQKNELGVRLDALDDFLKSACELESAESYLKKNLCNKRSIHSIDRYISKFINAQKLKCIDPLWSTINQLNSVAGHDKPWRTNSLPTTRLMDSHGDVIFENLGQLCGFLWRVDRYIRDEAQKMGKTVGCTAGMSDSMKNAVFTPMEHLFRALASADEEQESQIDHELKTFDLNTENPGFLHLETLRSYFVDGSQRDRALLEAAICEACLQIYGSIPHDINSAIGPHKFYSADAVISIYGRQLLADLRKVCAKENSRVPGYDVDSDIRQSLMARAPLTE